MFGATDVSRACHGTHPCPTKDRIARMSYAHPWHQALGSAYPRIVQMTPPSPERGKYHG